ncbi:MAG: hypothetical protein LLG06_17385 [Desulfobacteraceae bacterium]|nr:hypothetical protein [Desulfobacteraceae bacterium]
MKRFSRPLCVMLILLGCWGAFPLRAESAEAWEARYLFSRAVAQMEREGDKIRGVVFLQEPFREVSTYHFSGTIEGDSIFASHYTGHSFRGKFTGDDEISGVLRTSTGFSLTLKARRREGP